MVWLLEDRADGEEAVKWRSADGAASYSKTEIPVVVGAGSVRRRGGLRRLHAPEPDVRHARVRAATVTGTRSIA